MLTETASAMALLMENADGPAPRSFLERAIDGMTPISCATAAIAVGRCPQSLPMRLSAVPSISLPTRPRLARSKPWPNASPISLPSLTVLAHHSVHCHGSDPPGSRYAPVQIQLDICGLDQHSLSLKLRNVSRKQAEREPSVSRMRAEREPNVSPSLNRVHGR